MTHGASRQSPKRLSAVELGPFKVSCTNVPNRSHECYLPRLVSRVTCLIKRYGPDFFFGLCGRFHSRISRTMQSFNREGSILL
jgi:hypothetical protein